LNSVLSSSTVILLGDYLFAQSAMLAAATNSPRVVSIFAGTLGDICDGQLREMFVAHRLDQSREEYERRIYGKTASLFAGSAEMGAIIGNAPEAAVQALRQYGSDVGMAFQIVDDVLDLREGEERLGKPAGHDLTQGTVTLPTLIYAAGINEGSAEMHQLQGVVSGEFDDRDIINSVVEDIRRSGVLEESLREAERFADRAKERLRGVPDPETRNLLNEVADIVCDRSA
jgi:geranylgeranyl pyrophosphate synthase